ncbi:hypothetical protein NN561_000522 [Cricetulus griseus]
MTRGRAEWRTRRFATALVDIPKCLSLWGPSPAAGHLGPAGRRLCSQLPVRRCSCQSACSCIAVSLPLRVSPEALQSRGPAWKEAAPMNPAASLVEIHLDTNHQRASEANAVGGLPRKSSVLGEGIQVSDDTTDGKVLRVITFTRWPLKEEEPPGARFLDGGGDSRLPLPLGTGQGSCRILSPEEHRGGLDGRADEAPVFIHKFPGVQHLSQQRKRQELVLEATP